MKPLFKILNANRKRSKSKRIRRKVWIENKNSNLEFSNEGLLETYLLVKNKLKG